MPVGGRKHVVRRAVQPRLAVAGTRWDLAGAVVVIVARREGRPDRLLHRHLDEAASAAAVAIVERGHDAGVKVNPAHEIDEGRAGLNRRPVGKAGYAHDARGGLDRHVHRQIVAVGPADAEPGTGGVDQPRVYLPQPAPADAETVHRAGREIFEQDIGALDHAEKQFAAALVLEVQRDRVLVLIQHRKRQGRALARLGAPPPRLTVQRLDLDDEGARLRQQEAGIGALKDLAEIDYRHVGERPVRPSLLHRRSRFLAVPEISVAHRLRASHADGKLARRTCQ